MVVWRRLKWKSGSRRVYNRNMEDGEKPQEEQEAVVRRDEVRSSFDEFLKGDLKSVNCWMAVDRVKSS